MRESHRVGTKFCGSSPSIPEEELHRAILKAVQDLAANFTDEVAAQINGILHDIQTGESAKPNLQEQLEQTQQEFGPTAGNVLGLR